MTHESTVWAVEQQYNAKTYLACKHVMDEQRVLQQVLRTDQTPRLWFPLVVMVLAVQFRAVEAMANMICFEVQARVSNFLKERGKKWQRQQASSIEVMRPEPDSAALNCHQLPSASSASVALRAKLLQVGDPALCLLLLLLKRCFTSLSLAFLIPSQPLQATPKTMLRQNHPPRPKTLSRQTHPLRLGHRTLAATSRARSAFSSFCCSSIAC